MDNNRKDIGRAIRHKLEGMQEQQPQAAGWDKIKAGLDAQRPKQQTRIGLWFLGGIIALLTIGVSYFIWQGYVNRSTAPTPHTEIPAGGNGVVNNETKSNTVDSTLSGNGNNADTDNPSANADKNTANADNKTSVVKDGTSAKRNSAEKTKADTKNTVSITKDNTAASARTNNNTVSSNANLKRQRSANSGGTAGSATNNGNTGNRGNVIVHAATVGSGKTAERNKTMSARNVADTNTKDAKRKTNQNTLATAKNNSGYTNNAAAYTTTAVTNGTASAQSDTTSISSTTAQTKLLTPEATLKLKDSTAIAIDIDSLWHELAQKQIALATEDSTKNQSNSPSFKRFYAFAYAAPTQFVYPDKSAIDGRLNGLKTDAKFSVSYGAFLGYEFTVRWGIRAGVLLSRSERIVNGAVIDSLGETNYTGIHYTPGFSNNFLGQLYKGRPFSIHQKTELFEVPVEVTYRIAGNRWGAKLIAGGSVVQLRSEAIFIQNQTYKVAIGSPAYTNKTSFSAGLGAGLYYELSPKLQLNAEPFMRYYSNTFSAGNPFSLSLRVGLQYNFGFQKKRE